MLTAEQGTHILYAVFILVGGFILAISDCCWIRRICMKKRRDAEDVEGNSDNSSEQTSVVELDNVEGESDSDKSSEGTSVVELETETDHYEHIRTKAFLTGINLIVYSCRSKMFTVLLAQSKQPNSGLGVLNTSRQLKKGTMFGPLHPERSFEILQTKKTKKYRKAFQKLDLANNWLTFVNEATNPNEANMIILRNTDDGTYFYETTKNIKKGEELLAETRWSPIPPVN